MSRFSALLADEIPRVHPGFDSKPKPLYFIKPLTEFKPFDIKSKPLYFRVLDSNVTFLTHRSVLKHSERPGAGSVLVCSDEWQSLTSP